MLKFLLLDFRFICQKHLFLKIQDLHLQSPGLCFVHSVVYIINHHIITSVNNLLWCVYEWSLNGCDTNIVSCKCQLVCRDVARHPVVVQSCFSGFLTNVAFHTHTTYIRTSLMSSYLHILRGIRYRTGGNFQGFSLIVIFDSQLHIFSKI